MSKTAKLKVKSSCLKRCCSDSGSLNRNRKQFQIRFKRTADKKGKYRTRISLERGEREYHCSCGAVHRLFNLKYRFVGDIPSLSNTIKNSRPKSIKGHIIKGVLLVTDFIIKDTLKTGEDILKVSETATITLGKELVRSGSHIIRGKYRENAVDDYSKGTLFIAKSSFDAVRGTRTHIHLKRRYQDERQRYRKAKSDLKDFRKFKYKSEKKEIKNKISTAKKKYRIRKKEYKGNKQNLKKNALIKRLRKERKKQYRSDLKKLKNRRKNLKTELKNLKRKKHSQHRIQRLSKPEPLALKPIRYYGSQLKENAIHKAVHEDNNDMLRAIYEVKRRGIDRITESQSRHNRLRRQERKHRKYNNKNNKDNARLRKKETKLQNKNNRNKRKRNKRKCNNVSPKKSVSGNISSNILKLFRNPNNVYTKEVTATLISAVIPVFFILIIFFFILMIFSSIISGSGFVLGTYNAQDHALSKAEKYYTKLAWDMNEKIMLVGTSEWKKGLRDLGADTSSMSENPDIVQWGRSSAFNYDPVYDFDKYKLWSFLCAYYYDFSADTSNGDIRYWKYKNDTETVLKELFSSEYSFEYQYNNTSHWEQMYSYDFKGGIDGSYWLTDSRTSYKDCFYPYSAPGELNDFKDNNGYIHFNSNLEILNAKDDYKKTGWFIQDQRHIIRDNSGQQSNPFYSWFNDTEFGRYYGENYYPRSYWGWDDIQCYWLVSPDDTLHWRDDLHDTCLVSYYRANEWIKDCSLYYNIKQTSSFEETILKKLGSMSNAKERIAYYYALSGTDGTSSYYGNHQTLKNILSGNTIKDYKVFNGFGWNITEWNNKHCNSDNAVHEGVDIICPSGSKIYSPFDCKIQSFDNQTVVLRKNNVRYWYDGNKGAKRDTEVTIGNITLKSGFKVGDTIKQGDVFAVSTGNKHCDTTDNSTSQSYIHLQTRIDTDGIGWDYTDPLLIVY